VTELYTSLQNGVIDGIWNGLINADSNNFWSVVDYVSNLKVAYSDAFGMVVSLDVWNSWPTEAQELIQNEAQAIYEYSHSYVAEHNQAIWDKLEADADIEVYYIPDDEAAKFGALMGPVQLENMRNNVGDESYEEIMSIIDKYNK
jgi:TRAP-type C4-dicarboxylate transport system substrate-binding protein